MKSFKNILITGASSGIGRSLAAAYSGPEVNLFLCGRNKERLAKTQDICKAKGANVLIESFDINDEKSAFDFVKKIEENYQIDLVIANAGTAVGKAGDGESFKDAKQIIATNINGVINIIYPALDQMKKRNYGQIAIISSLAGFQGIPSSPAYSASKAAVRVYAAMLRANLHKFNIGVSSVCPGYVKTPMIEENSFYMPFLMSSKQAAEIIKNGLAKNKSQIIFPLFLYFILFFIGLFPRFIIDFIYSKIAKCTML